jgi:hypothetical protein
LGCGLKIYLIGVEHDVQRKTQNEVPTGCQVDFQSAVESAIQSIRPVLVAEEDHPDFLSMHGKESILQLVASAQQPKIEPIC